MNLVKSLLCVKPGKIFKISLGKREDKVFETPVYGTVKEVDSQNCLTAGLFQAGNGVEPAMWNGTST